MAKKATKATQGHAHPKVRRKKSGPFKWIAAAVLLIAVGGYYVLTNAEPAADAALQYAEQDVAHNKPFLAIHEMRPGPRIPFLPADQPQPRIAIPNAFFDFGQIGAKAIVTRKFLVRNEGEAPLTISRAYTTCGCTTAEFTARVIPPGKLAMVTLTLNAGFHDVRGQTVKRGIIIENNDRRKSKAEIWTRASVGRN